MNQVNLVGRLGKDPEVRYTTAGKAVANFSLAINRPGGSGEDKVTDWIECVVWERQAEILSEYAQKGREIGVTGRIQVRKFTDRDGVERKATEIVCSHIYLLSGGRQDDQAGGGGGGGGGGGQQRSESNGRGRQAEGQRGGGRQAQGASSGRRQQRPQDEYDGGDLF